MIAALAELAGHGSLLATYVPFKTPLYAAYDWWYLLLIPLAFGIALVYKTLRLDDLRRLWAQTILMTVQIVLAMAALAIALGIFILYIIPLLPER